MSGRHIPIGANVEEYQEALGPGSLPTGGDEGDVLTKQSNADGDAGWEPAGGGSQPFVSVVKHFDAATILAIDPMDDSTWPEVLPELSGERFYLVQGFVATVHAGMTPYAAAPAMQLVTPGDSDLIYFPGGNLTLPLDSATDVMRVKGDDTNDLNDYDPAQFTGAHSAAMLYLNPQPTLGDGTVTLSVVALVMDTAAA